MGDPATLVEAATPPVVTAIPTVMAGEMQDGTKTQSANKNGKKADSGSSSSFFTWFIVLALLGVWTSVAVVYFDLVDYQGVLDETPADAARRGAQKESPPTKDVGLKLREALKQQLAIIHERVEARKLAKLALAEVRELLAKEEEEKKLELGRKEITARVKERVATRLREEEEKMEKDEIEKVLEKLRKEKTKQLDEKKEGQDEDEKEGEKKSKKGGEKEKSEKKVECQGKKTREEFKGRGKESVNEKRKKSDRGGKK